MACWRSILLETQQARRKLINFNLQDRPVTKTYKVNVNYAIRLKYDESANKYLKFWKYVT